MCRAGRPRVRPAVSTPARGRRSNCAESAPPARLTLRVRVIYVGFDDPPRLAADAHTEQERLEPYRRVRDEIRAYVETLPECLGARAGA